MRIGVAGAVLTWLAVLTYFDVRQRRLPNALTLPGGCAVLVAAVIAGRGVPAFAGAAALLGVYLAVHLVAPTSMGAGDVKLAIGLGGLAGCFGVGVWFLAALGAPVLTVLAAVLGGVRVLPHGPSMCLATALAVGLTLL